VTICVICNDPERPVNPPADLPAAHRSCSDEHDAYLRSRMCVCGCTQREHDGLASKGKCRQCGWKYCRRFKRALRCPHCNRLVGIRGRFLEYHYRDNKQAEICRPAVVRVSEILGEARDS
jgi:predicted Zn-ribbon and HTH transcriptional regulator